MPILYYIIYTKHSQSDRTRTKAPQATSSVDGTIEQMKSDWFFKLATSRRALFFKDTSSNLQYFYLERPIEVFCIKGNKIWLNIK